MANSINGMAELFRARLARPETIALPGCYDVLSALISDQVTDQSQLLMHRHLSDRLPRIAPFLAYDKDPYLVIDDAGRLVWIQDAYTMSDRFPDAQSFDPTEFNQTGLGRAPFN